MSETCPVCGSKVSDFKDVSIRVVGARGYCYSCPRCGDYQIQQGCTPEELRGVLGNDSQKIAVLSHWIRTKHESISRNKSRSESIILTPDLVGNILSQSPPSCVEQAAKFVLWLGNSGHPAGELVRVHPTTHQSIMGAVTAGGFKLVLDYLLEIGHLGPTAFSQPDGRAEVMLTVKGWDYYDKLRRGAADSRKAFMAMKYGVEELDKLVEGVLKPAVKQTGFDLFRLVDRPQAGLLDNRLRVEIQTSRFLIADLSHENAGAYWEAGYAEGLGKPVIYTCEKNRFETCKTHFDTNHHLTLQWDSSGSTGIAEELKATIRATLPAEAKLTDD